MGWLDLIFPFLEIGFFSFGGGYGSIALIRDVVIRNGWMNDQMFTNLIAVCESTPGPVMVNMATYIGSKMKGFPGAVVATACVVLPAFVIMVLVTILFKNLIKKKAVQAAFSGIRPCITGVILATGLWMGISAVSAGTDAVDNLKTVLIILVLFGTGFLHQKRSGKEISPILLIVISGVMGGILYSF